MVNSSDYGKGWRSRRKRILDRDGWVCAWCECNLKAPDVKATVDHVTSRKQGLAAGWTLEQINDDSNLAAACGTCNSSRSERPGPPKHGRDRDRAKRAAAGPFLSSLPPLAAGIGDIPTRASEPTEPRANARWTMTPNGD
jgi:5-methylcytosine-specific restriction endonuclease McrA